MPDTAARPGSPAPLRPVTLGLVLALLLAPACRAGEEAPPPSGTGTAPPAGAEPAAPADTGGGTAAGGTPAASSAVAAGPASSDVPAGPASGVRTPQQQVRPSRGEAWVVFGTDTVRAEVARTPEQRERGLMFRETLPEGRGMLFVFDRPEVRSFWMKDTYIPLDIAFIDETFRIVDIQQMEPRTEDPHISARPAMFALEVPRGWFAAHGIRVGDEAVIVFGPS